MNNFDFSGPERVVEFTGPVKTVGESSVRIRCPRCGEVGEGRGEVWEERGGLSVTSRCEACGEEVEDSYDYTDFINP